jgi:GNAT superfamily N-acetyltransferase
MPAAGATQALRLFGNPLQVPASPKTRRARARKKQGHREVITVNQSDTTNALVILREISEWLIEKNMPLWNPDDFINGKFVRSIGDGNLCTAYIGTEPVAAMVLQWSDPAFWPNSIGNSGFIHKLAVKREFAGKGISRQFIDWAKDEVRSRNRSFLRLDCAADRPKLCNIYEELGFLRIERRMVGIYDIAFYELKV